MFGNAHYNIGKQIIDKIDIDLSPSEKNAFLSGMVYADIGRFKFDKQSSVESDSTHFVSEMKKYTITNEEKWFAYGIEMHILQDEKTGEFLSNIFGEREFDYCNYILECGFLDYYFLKKTSSYIYNEFLTKFNFTQVNATFDLNRFSKFFEIPESNFESIGNSMILNFYSGKNKNNLVTYDELIIKTYRSFEVKLSIDEIHEQEANILGTCAAACTIASRQKFPEKIITKIDLETKKIVDLCKNALQFPK